MQMPDPNAPFPIRLPGGEAHRGTVHLSQVLNHPNIEVGDYTYYSDFDPPEDPAALAFRLAPYLFPNSSEMLRIGRFCQLAHGTRFITARANHPMGGISTYPFPVFDPATMGDYRPDERDTVIGSDVWFGYGAMAMPGARIGHGVVVGAGAVVRGTVPDYAVVIGNPAVVVRMRFAPDQIGALLEVAWWDRPHDWIAAHRPLIEGGDIEALVRAARQ